MKKCEALVVHVLHPDALALRIAFGNCARLRSGVHGVLNVRNHFYNRFFASAALNLHIFDVENASRVVTARSFLIGDPPVGDFHSAAIDTAD